VFERISILAVKFSKLRVAVAGTSFGSLVQIPVFQSHPRTQVVAVSSGRRERAEKAARDFGIAAYFTDFEEMLEKEKPDVVSIVTPPSLHCAMTLAAVGRGIHVLCEKPFALNLEEARRMRDATERANLIGMIDYEFRFLPARAYATELLRQNYAGEIRMADFTFHMGMRSKAEDVGWDWWSDVSQGGGALGALGSHAIDTLCYWMGEPRRVFCDLATFVKERSGKQVTSDDSYTMLIEFTSGARASIQMSIVAGVSDSRIGIHGSDGQLIVSNGSGLHGGKRADRKIGPIEIPEHYRLPREDQHLRPPFRVLLNRMVQAIDNRLPSPSPNFVDAVLSQAVIDAAHISSKEGRWIEVAKS
jgi:predicted dehydrogenase